MSLFGGNCVKAFEMAAIEDHSETKMAANNMICGGILH